MEEYITIAEAARRLGNISDKTIRRAIASGKLIARYPHPNRAEIAVGDLQTWYASLRVPPGATQDRLLALETRVSDLEAEVKSLRHQLENSALAATKRPPKPTTTAPEGFTYLSDFCTSHHVSYQAAADLFPRAIHGQPITIKGRKHPMIGPKGRRDFYIQLHNRPDFRTCDDCPHNEEHGHTV